MYRVRETASPSTIWGGCLLTPGSREGISEGLEIVDPSLSNLAVNRVHSQSKVIHEHGGKAEGLVEWIGVSKEPFNATYWTLPAGLRVRVQVFPRRLQVIWHRRVTNIQQLSESIRYSPLLHFVGVFDQMTSNPLVTASSPLPVPTLFAQPRSCSSMDPASGGGPKTS